MTATTMAEEFAQSLQAPSSTHLRTTYPLRAIPRSSFLLGDLQSTRDGNGPQINRNGPKHLPDPSGTLVRHTIFLKANNSTNHETPTCLKTSFVGNTGPVSFDIGHGHLAWDMGFLLRFRTGYGGGVSQTGYPLRHAEAWG